MAEQRLPGNIGVTEKILATTPVGGEAGKLSVPTQAFSSFMKPNVSPMEAAGKGSVISPFELMQGQPRLAQGPSADHLVQQLHSVQSTVGDISDQLNTPGLKLKASQKYLMKNKLADATTNLRSANAKLGTEVLEPPTLPQMHGPLARFFSYLTDGQAQLESAKNQLQSLKTKGEHLSPGDFLLVQIKLNKAAQELEFVSVLLSNAVSDVKQMMQVQL